MESLKKIGRATKRNETVLRCPICKQVSHFLKQCSMLYPIQCLQLTSCVVNTLLMHLRRTHSTTFGLVSFKLFFSISSYNNLKQEYWITMENCCIRVLPPTKMSWMFQWNISIYRPVYFFVVIADTNRNHLITYKR